jgi:hypothetical protein
MTNKMRRKLVEEKASSWLKKSQIIKSIVSSNRVPLITYEHFCENPALILDLLNLPDGVSETIELDARVSVKDYKPQTISNQNSRQISRLSSKDVTSINRVLREDPATLEFFGYQLI